MASFCKWADTIHPLPTDHWAVEPVPGWHHDPLWTRVFPQFDEPASREDRIRRYWDEYHARSADLAERFPNHVRIFPWRA